MGNMDSWDVTLLVVAAYLAIVSLIRLMARRRSQVFEELSQQAEKEKQNKKAQEILQARRQRSA
jgi:hypothetical protein